MSANQVNNFLNTRAHVARIAEELRHDQGEVEQNGLLQPTQFWDFDEPQEPTTKSGEVINNLFCDTDIGGAYGVLAGLEEAVRYQASTMQRGAEATITDSPAKSAVYATEATRLKVLEEGVITLKCLYQSGMTTLQQAKHQLMLEEAEAAMAETEVA